jgi:hypothetical protein
MSFAQTISNPSLERARSEPPHPENSEIAGTVFNLAHQDAANFRLAFRTRYPRSVYRNFPSPQASTGFSFRPRALPGVYPDRPQGTLFWASPPRAGIAQPRSSRSASPAFPRAWHRHCLVCPRPWCRGASRRGHSLRHPIDRQNGIVPEVVTSPRRAGTTAGHWARLIVLRSLAIFLNPPAGSVCEFALVAAILSAN